MNNNLIIGFTNKFFTLWQIQHEEKQFECGVEKVTKYIYMKNISMDEAKVRSEYPGVTIDMELRGHSSFIFSSEKVYDNSLFLFGKYKAEKIEDCGDSSYLRWYYNAGIPTESKLLVEQNLIKKGFHALNGGFLTDDEWNEYNERISRRDNLVEEIKKGDFTFVPVKNLDEEGWLELEDGVWVNFVNFEQKYYNGYIYGLPTINGKAKRIKNKNVKILDFNIEHENDDWNYHVYINNFEIIK